MKKFWLSEWQHKGAPFVRALLDAEYKIDENNPDFVLFDHDIDIKKKGWRAEMMPYINRNIPIFLYPHGARPMTLWDGVYPACPNVVANFVPAPGHQEVMRRYDYPIKTIPIGFSFCKIQPFRPTAFPGLIVFAPIHPLRSGFVQPEDKAINQRTMKKLMNTGLPVLVRYIGTIEQNGLKFEQGVEYLKGETNGSTAEIDKAALVVASDTFLYMAVARGVPAISIRERSHPFWGKRDKKVYAKKWPKYKNYMGYPYDEDDYDDLNSIIPDLLPEESNRLKEWKELFIWKQFDYKEFVYKINGMINQ